MTQIVPVSEGYILYKSMMTSNVGGDTVTKNIIDHIERNRGQELLPHFYYQYTMEQESQRTATLKDIGHVDPSILEFHKKRFIQELKELYFKVNTHSEDSYETLTRNQEPIYYELPDGHVVNFGANRSSFADIFFSESPVEIPNLEAQRFSRD